MAFSIKKLWSSSYTMWFVDHHEQLNIVQHHNVHKPNHTKNVKLKLAKDMYVWDVCWTFLSEIYSLYHDWYLQPMTTRKYMKFPNIFISQSYCGKTWAWWKENAKTFFLWNLNNNIVGTFKSFFYQITNTREASNELEYQFEIPLPSFLSNHFMLSPALIYLPCGNLRDRFSFPTSQTGNVYLEQECVLMQSVCTFLPASVDMSTSTIVLFDH